MKTEFIKWWKEDPLRNSINCIDFICAILAVITFFMTALNISAAIHDQNTGDCAFIVLVVFLISSGIWAVNSLFQFVREFRKMF